MAMPLCVAVMWNPEHAVRSSNGAQSRSLSRHRRRRVFRKLQQFSSIRKSKKADRSGWEASGKSLLQELVLILAGRDWAPAAPDKRNSLAFGQVVAYLYLVGTQLC
jgi:hypothetical protein